MYRLRLLDTARKDLESLDPDIGRRISKKLQWLAENLGQLQPQPLKGDLSGLYKFRIGDYRVIYELLPEEELILIHTLGHRRDIYKS